MRAALRKWAQLLLAVWWVVHYTGGIQGLLFDLVDGPYTNQNRCIEATRWYTEHHPLPSSDDRYFCHLFNDIPSSFRPLNNGFSMGYGVDLVGGVRPVGL